MRLNMQKGNTEIQLFNLETDSREQLDVAQQHPDLVTRALEIMAKEHRRSALERFYIIPLDK
jgi:hypothetical protein